MKEIEEFLAGLGWNRELDFGNRVWYVTPDEQMAVLLADGWEMHRLMEGGIEDGLSNARYLSEAEGLMLSELRAAMEACGLKVAA